MILTTTGLTSTVTIVGLKDNSNNDLVLTHPQTINLLDFYDSEDLQSVQASIQALIDVGEVTAANEDGETIDDIDEVTGDISSLHPLAFSGDWADLKNKPSIPGAAPVNSVNGQVGIVVLDKGDVGLPNVDNTSDADKPISTTTQSALNSKYDSSNPQGYETPTQLNARDAANRARVNHTGTQLADTISDFASAVRDTILTGLSAAINAGNIAAVAATDTVLSAIEKLQARTALLFYGQYVRNAGTIILENTTQYDYIVLNANVPVTGDYEINWNYLWSLDDGAKDFIGRLSVNGTIEWEHRQEPKDTAGPGVIAPDTTGGTGNSGTNQRHLASGHDILPLNAGANEIKLILDASANGDDATIYKGIVSIKKWGLS